MSEVGGKRGGGQEEAIRVERTSPVGAVDGPGLVRPFALAGGEPLVAVLQAGGGKRREPGTDARDRRVARQVSLLRCSAGALPPAVTADQNRGIFNRQ